jgi:tRNA pseudouridine55 synthase
MARRRPPTVHGIAVVDKPVGVTSHDVVAMLRRRFHERRVGHAGTLDPGATGVLVVGVGWATRLLRFVTDGRKSYTGEVVLGVETDTLDADGRATAVREVAAVDLDHVRALVAEHLVGRIEQVPPMVSAVRVGGRRLHELAREGVEVARDARQVTVDRFDVVAVTSEPGGPPVLAAEVDCSAGTYVRVLAADLGALLGTGAHLRNLRRTAVWPFTLEEAAAPDECELLPLAAAVRALDTVQIDDETAARIAVGAVLPAPAGDGPWAMITEGGDLLAVYEPFDRDRAKPAVVLPTSPPEC